MADYKINDRVVKTKKPASKIFAAVGERGLVIQHLEKDVDDAYILVRWDATDRRHQFTEWCFETELTPEVEWDRAAELSAANVIVMPPPVVDEIRGDGPTPVYGDGFDHPTLGPRSETIYPDSELVEIVNVRQQREVAVAYDPPGGIPGQRPDRIMVEGPAGEFTWLVNLTESEYRKMLPVGTVVTEYWPDAMKGAAAVAWVGNEKHNPGEHLHWARDKSTDHDDCLARHRIDAKNSDGWDTVSLPDGRVYQVRHAAAALWRAACLAQLDAESVGGQVVRRLK